MSDEKLDEIVNMAKIKIKELKPLLNKIRELGNDIDRDGPLFALYPEISALTNVSMGAFKKHHQKH